MFGPCKTERLTSEQDPYSEGNEDMHIPETLDITHSFTRAQIKSRGSDNTNNMK